MEFNELEQSLQSLCKKLGEGVTCQLYWGSTKHAQIDWPKQGSYYSISIGVNECCSHIFWSIAYQAIQEGNISLEDAQSLITLNQNAA